MPFSCSGLCLFIDTARLILLSGRTHVSCWGYWCLRLAVRPNAACTTSGRDASCIDWQVAFLHVSASRAALLFFDGCDSQLRSMKQWIQFKCLSERHGHGFYISNFLIPWELPRSSVENIELCHRVASWPYSKSNHGFWSIIQFALLMRFCILDTQHLLKPVDEAVANKSSLQCHCFFPVQQCTLLYFEIHNETAYEDVITIFRDVNAHALLCHLKHHNGLKSFERWILVNLLSSGDSAQVIVE